MKAKLLHTALNAQMLERAGLVVTKKIGRVRTCSKLEAEAAWIESCRKLWDERFDALSEVVDTLKRKEQDQ